MGKQAKELAAVAISVYVWNLYISQLKFLEGVRPVLFIFSQLGLYCAGKSLTQEDLNK